jgi:predicted DNA-binding protein (MmcQ/YjbR family)
MDRASLLAYCLSKPGAWQDTPWGDDPVAKVGPKVFAIFGIANQDGLDRVGVKCGRSRDEADEWLARYPDDAVPMPYLAKQGWNALRVDGSIPEDELSDAVDASYESVVARLPARLRPPR